MTKLMAASSKTGLLPTSPSLLSSPKLGEDPSKRLGAPTPTKC